MHPVGFETTISAGERPQTYALNRAATGIGSHVVESFIKEKQPKVIEKVMVTLVTSLRS
jgi:hypothetical protein